MMSEIIARPDIIRAITACVCTILSYLFGEFDLVFRALLAMVIIDYLTGMLAAFITRTLSSEVGSKGIARKVCIFILISVAGIVDSLTVSPEPFLRTAVIWFFIANEGLSILENVGKMGVPLPEVLVSALEKLHKAHTGDKK
jgi:toxin secretion/phage lysis holin